MDYIVAVLIKPGSIEQLVYSFLVSLTFLVLCAVSRPPRDDSDNMFSDACNFCLTAMFFCCVLLKLGTLTEAVNPLLPPQRLSWRCGCPVTLHRMMPPEKPSAEMGAE